MSSVDLLLNLVGLLLWVTWRSIRLDPPRGSKPVSLAGTLGPAAPRRSTEWALLVALGVLLVLRAWLYRQLGSAVDWVPKLDVGLIVLPFRSDRFYPVLLFSILSFARLWVLFYFWLAVLALCQRRNREADPILKLVRLHLGRVGRWHWTFQAALLLGLVALGWLGAYPLLVRLDIIGPVRSPAALAGQSALVAGALLLSLKVLLPVLLLVYFLTSYVYLGDSPWWEFVGACARTILAPLQRLPLQVGRLDLAPLVGVILLLALLHLVPELVLRRLSQAQVAIWPQ